MFGKRSIILINTTVKYISGKIQLVTWGVGRVTLRIIVGNLHSDLSLSD